MTSSRRRVTSALSLLIIVGVVSGCASIGMRPAEPPFVIVATDGPCLEYQTYWKYAAELQEAYHTRATQNRGWLYVAAILGLAVMAASGGLAIATTAAAGTLGLLSISGAFAASSFATINNEALAVSYTVAANSVDQARRDSQNRLRFVGSDKKVYTPASCEAALPILIVGVSDARTHLEVARTDNAAGALARARDQLKLLKDQIAAEQTTAAAADITHVTLTAEVVNVEPRVPEKDAEGKPKPVTITVRNAKLDTIGLGEVKVVFGTKELAPTAIAQSDPDDLYTYTVKFTAPATKPDEGKLYRPALLIQGKTRIGHKPEKEDKVKYEYP